MLSASKLKEFLEAAKTEIPVVKSTFRVVGDDDVSNFSKDVKSSDPGVVLVGILPSFGLNFQNLDNYGHDNKMMFFILKKMDTRGGNEGFLSLFDETGDAVMDFEKWLFERSQKFPCPAIFKEIDFRSFHADPVRDYYSLCGYVVSFDLKTK